MPLTVSEIAHRLAKPEERNTLRERIRHWTREGLVKPIGERNPGTGRHRLYEESVLVDVAILNALAGLGVQVRDLHAVLGRAQEKVQWLAKEPQDAIIYLVISYYGGNEPSVWVERANPVQEGVYRMFAPGGALASLYINISRIHEVIAGKRPWLSNAFA
jgi:DNA-binding transcriptional MerR regulator